MACPLQRWRLGKIAFWRWLPFRLALWKLMAVEVRAGLDCFTDHTFFFHCCCGNKDKDVIDCWKQTPELAEDCCDHLMHHCPENSRGWRVALEASSRGRTSPPSSEADAWPSGSLLEEVEQMPSADAVHVAFVATRGSSGRSEVVATMDNCWESHVYSRQHCCDARFAPPASRCFETVEAFDRCCATT
eukprot:TRINITY_DN71920_c0_g1_i1.p1 TRINITY_DN71920_c0_g1~~TRINITY_DN71920_c0_g1_i1.p1  ORF type:complete len:188 (-),score=27.99 TRINITY_DN71920_c0_g1_i1:244-807(-)